MEKRVFLAIFLCFVVLAGYQAFFAPPTPSPATAPVTAAANATTGMTSAPAQGATAAATQNVVSTPLVADTAARDVVVETDTTRAVFSTSGARLLSFTLKKYLQDGQPLELVPIGLSGVAKPFTLSTNDPALSKTLESALYQPSTTNLSLGSASGTLEFQYRDQSGLNARKVFHFQPDGKAYVVRVEASVDVAGVSRPVTLSWGPALGLGYAPDGSRYMPPRGIKYADGSMVRPTASAIVKQSHYDGEMKFAGVEDQYFLSAALPGPEKITLDYQPVTVPIPGDPKNRTRTFVAYNVGTPGPLAMSFFLGPKDFDILRNVDSRLELVRAIDFGMFSVIVVPLLQGLKSINSFVGNYGWSIVVLTLLINILIFPFRHMSMVSMKKMQAVQPEVKAIQERFAKYKITDPERQKMNQEVMELYKQRGVSPASGCVPMLLTLPVLFAFYALLNAAIELRGAPFAGWIHDLARHDPYYITPVLMGVTMLWQQRMMPSTADPIQQKMFLLMPVVFTVSFLWAPAGLVLYWFTSNLLAIGQQYLTNRLIAVPVRSVVKTRRK